MAVKVTIIGRARQKHEVLTPRLLVRPLGPFEFEKDRFTRAPSLDGDDLTRAPVAFHDAVSDLAKTRQHRPARFHRARSRDAVTLALGTELVPQILKQREILKVKQGRNSEPSHLTCRK